MKLISWNVNGLRACMEKGFSSFLEAESPDLIALQETKMQPEQAEILTPGYTQYWNSAEKKGYSGTAIFSKLAPLSVRYGLNRPEFDTEGKVITLEFDSFFFVTSYTPNSQDGLKRIGYRMEFDDALRSYLMKLDAEKPVILCGDLNVANQEIELKNPDQNREHAGFSLQEREKMTRLLASGFSDSFRVLYPEATGRYSWWSYRFSARQRNAGWRIDYFIVSERLMPAVQDSLILDTVMGSDHCPVGLILEV